MREILFRGKRVDNGEWVYGNLVEWLNETKDVSIIAHPFGCCIDEVGNLVLIEEPFVCKVHPETVGQDTGMTDRNGNKIFEGDECTFGIFTPKNKAVVNFEKARFILVWGSVVGAFGERARHSEHLMFAENLEIIGNIHDEEEDDEL